MSRLTLLLVLLQFLPLVALGQDEDDDAGPAPIQVWHCLAGWSVGDTMYYEVLSEDRTYQNGTITAKRNSNTRIRVLVSDSSDAGYLLKWQWLISDPLKATDVEVTDTVLLEMSRALSTLNMTVHTRQDGHLESVNDLETSIVEFVENFERFAKLYEHQLDSAMKANAAMMATVFREQKGVLGASLFASIELFFRPFGYEILSDSFYVAPYRIRNAITGEPVPGNIRVELRDVNDLNYQMDAVFHPDDEEMTKQVRETLNRVQKANKAKRYSLKEVRAFGLEVQREEHFVIHTANGWPKHIHSLVTSAGSGMRREIERTVTSDVHIGRVKNELYYDERISVDPFDPENYILRADIRAKRGDLAGAEEDLTMAYDLSPGKNVLQRRAWVRIERLMYAEALVDIDEALRIDSMDVYSIDQRTTALSNLHRYAEALANAERSMRIAPDLRFSMVGAGKALVNLYRYPEAIAIYTKILEQDTSDWSTYGLRADAYKYLNSAEGDSLAQADIERSLTIRPDNYSALITLGNLHMDRGELTEAIAVFDTILAQGMDMTALHNRGYARVQLGELDAGIKDLEDALDLEPGHAYAPNNLGWAYHLRGENNKALEWIDKGIQRQPTNSYAFYNKGRVLLSEHRVAEACEALYEAERLGFSVGYGPMAKDLLQGNCPP